MASYLEVRIHAQFHNVHMLRKQAVTEILCFSNFWSTNHALKESEPYHGKQTYFSWDKHLNAFVCILLMS